MNMLEKPCTPEICLEAVKQDGYVIKYLTENQRTPEICLEAVKQNGYAIKYLTKSTNTRNLLRSC